MDGTQFVNELKARGFSAFTVDQLLEYVNWGYREVARRSKWNWLETSDTLTLTVGQYTTLLSDIDNFSSIIALYILTPTTDIRKLEPISRGVFLKRWLSRDLSAVSRGIPNSYITWDHNLYVLPPSDATRTFTIYYHLGVAELDIDWDTSPISPVDFDESILKAAEWRCHVRAKEFDIASVAKNELEEFLQRFLDQETYEQEEQFDRVRPDDTWR